MADSLCEWCGVRWADAGDSDVCQECIDLQNYYANMTAEERRADLAAEIQYIEEHKNDDY